MDFLRCARKCLMPGAVLAAAIADGLEHYDGPSSRPPAPDMREVDGVVYSSQAVAVREERRAFAIERVREVVELDGERREEDNTVRLDRMTARLFATEGARAGFRPLRARRIPHTREYVGSDVAMLRA
jgi:hypothetical protein